MTGLDPGALDRAARVLCDWRWMKPGTYDRLPESNRQMWRELAARVLEAAIVPPVA